MSFEQRNARRRPPVELPAQLPVRMINEVVYCPRLFYYEWVESLFAHSADTVAGAQRHEKLGSRADPLPKAQDPLAQPPGAERIHARSVLLASDALGLVASMDLVEADGARATPVDYKKGQPREGADGPEAWPSDRVQVCAQALVLRDAGYQCDEAVLYYHGTRQRVRVPLTDELVAETLAAAKLAREIAASGRIPPPLVDSPKCPRCSLVAICLPDETSFLETLPPEVADPRQPTLFVDPISPSSDPEAPEEEDALRRLVPARDDLRPLYVIGNGLTVGKTGHVLRITKRGVLVEEVRMNELSQVSVFGSAMLTSGAIQALCTAEIPIAHFSQGSWFYGITQGLALKNVFLRKDQFEKADNAFFCALVARALVATKIANQRTLLQRNHVEPPQLVLRQMKELAERAASCTELSSLLGIEGAAARLYFSEFAGMIKAERAESLDGATTLSQLSFDLQGRNRRPPRDPVNALLSFAYALLAKDLTIVCHAVGFDPYLGFLHQPRFGRPALALDLMEGFRPLIADSAVLAAINRRMVQPTDFVSVGPSVALSPSGRKAMLRAYEQRMDTLVTHPLFGYRVNYRRVLEIQTRLLARVVTGELARYPGFETR